MTQGTLSDPAGVPDPAFSLPGTLNWMRALAILVNANGIDAAAMHGHFSNVQKGAPSDQATNTVYEQLLMSLHHLAALRAMSGQSTKINAARSAIVTWYYGVFHAASAMIAAQDGSYQDNHTETANAWDSQFAATGLAPAPFGYRVSTLVAKDVESQIQALRGGSTHALEFAPTDSSQALGACMSYLKGSARWRAEYIEDDLLRKDLKRLGLTNFRSKQARELCDSRLQGRAFGFVHQAFRYRGKANYREALFISYGQNVESQLVNFYSDLEAVSAAFLCMAGSFCARRIGKGPWNDYFDDLTLQTRFSVKPAEIWRLL